jgi:hypothetical protein
MHFSMIDDATIGSLCREFGRPRDEVVSGAEYLLARGLCTAEHVRWYLGMTRVAHALERTRHCDLPPAWPAPRASREVHIIEGPCEICGAC